MIDQIRNNLLIRLLIGSWQTFKYNYCWSDYVRYIDGWIPKLALTVPILGYLILFNDKVSDILIFKTIANEDTLSFGLSGQQRLRSLYFGLIFLGVSNFIYIIKKPYLFKFGTNLVDYSKTCLELFTLSDYIQMHSMIQDKGYLTSGGKNYGYEWQGFCEDSSISGEDTDDAERHGNWEAAKSKYGGLLRGLLSETFFRYDTGGRCWLSLCLFLSSLGYLFLLAPSGDLFIKVCISIWP